MANRVGRLASILIVSLGLGFNTYALESGIHCLIRDEGTTAMFACPCKTGVGSFSKSDEKGTIWSNGIVAKDKRGRFSFENDSVTIRNLIPSDQGEFVWVCDETYWATSVCLTVRGLREGKHTVAMISVNTGTWNWQPLAVAIAGAIVLIFAVAIAVCLVLKRDKRGGIHYVSILEQNNFDRFISASVESKKEPKDEAPPSLNQTKTVYSIDCQTIGRQRELEKQLLVSLSTDSSSSQM